jgi:formate-dependent nitrite reductase membrane component NrfD
MIYLLPSRPSWNTWLLPLTLLASSLTNGLMLAWALAVLVPQQAGETGRPDLAGKLRGWSLPVLVVYAVISVAFFLFLAGKASPVPAVGLTGGLVPATGPVGLSRLLTGDLALLFWLGLVVVGLIAPAALTWMAKKDAKIFALASFLMVLAGGLVVRVMLFPLGTRIPLTNLW